jgi:hypothetical protein
MERIYLPRFDPSSIPIPIIRFYHWLDIIISLSETLSVGFFFVLFCFSFLVNPIASSHFHNAQQQNLTQNYSLHPSPMQANSFDASFNPANNFNNFDQTNQFQMQYNQQQPQTFDQQPFEGGNIQQQQFMGQSTVVGQQQLQQQGINNGSAPGYQHSINDLLVQPTTNLFGSQETSTNQSVSIVWSMLCLETH